MRTTSDHRLIVGGEDEEVDSATYRAKSMGRKSTRLLTKLQSLIPDCQPSVNYCWSGAFGESDEGLPIIDAVPSMPNCFVVLGFGGNGTIYSMLASQILPTLLRGKPDRDAAIFRFR
jgi:glycine/D-amino acid oxidase-like deaminating enzyme